MACLLAIELALWALDRFQWYPFKGHKGWAVLVALGIAGVLLAAALLWCMTAWLFRRRFQFTIRSLLAFTVVIALLAGWLSAEVRCAGRQKRAVEAMIWFLDVVLYDFQVGDRRRTANAPAFLRNVFGDDFFADVVYARRSLQPPNRAQCERFREADALSPIQDLTGLQEADFTRLPVTDMCLRHLRALPQLGKLSLSGGTCSITDAGMAIVGKLPRLRELSVWNGNVSDAGLKHLAGMDLETLTLYDTLITGSGLVYLKDMPNLRSLTIGGMQGETIGDAGLQPLEGLHGLRRLMVVETKITDNGLCHIGGLTNLEELDLSRNQITDKGLEHLCRLSALRTLHLEETRVTGTGFQWLGRMSRIRELFLTESPVADVGLGHLKDLTDLRVLNLYLTEVTDAGLVQLEKLVTLETVELRETHVTAAGAKRLQKALPKCEVIWEPSDPDWMRPDEVIKRRMGR
jgi:hypothetical protein